MWVNCICQPARFLFVHKLIEGNELIWGPKVNRNIARARSHARTHTRMHTGCVCSRFCSHAVLCWHDGGQLINLALCIVFGYVRQVHSKGNFEKNVIKPLICHSKILLKQLSRKILNKNSILKKGQASVSSYKIAYLTFCLLPPVWFSLARCLCCPHVDFLFIPTKAFPETLGSKPRTFGLQQSKSSQAAPTHCQ